MSFVQEVFAVLVGVGAMGTYHCISTINARVVSYAERVWPWAGLCFLAFALFCGLSMVDGLQSQDKETVPLFFCAGLASLLFAYLCHLAWMSALDEDAD